MTRAEIKQAKQLAKTQKAEKELQKKVTKTTLSWLDLYSIEQDKMLIGKNPKHLLIKKGIKLTPHNIILDDENTQNNLINGIRQAMNGIPCPMDFLVVYSPVNCDVHINKINSLMVEEEDIVRQQMLSDDLEKVYNFQTYHKEKEFFILIEDYDEKVLDKNLADLYGYWRNAGLDPKYLNIRDFYSLVSHAFDNPMINDYKFNRGIMSYLNGEIEYSIEKDKYEFVDKTPDFREYGDPIPNERPSMNVVQKSKIAPCAFIVNRDFRTLQVGDKYLCTMIVTQLPQNFPLGLLSDFINRPYIRMSMHTERSYANLAKMLNADLREKENRYRKSSDQMEKQRLLTEIESQQRYIQQVVGSGDRTHNVTILFQIIANDLKELNDRKVEFKNRLSSATFTVVDGALLQEQLFKLSTACFESSGLNDIVADNIALPLTSYDFSGLYPFIYETLDDPDGYLLGQEMANGGKVFFDIFYYLHQPSLASRSNRINGNTIVIGRAGSGKTTTMNVLIRDLIKKNTYIVWVDPENKNKNLTKRFNGTYVAWGKKSKDEDNIINVFDLKPISVDDDADMDDVEKWNTELAINNVAIDVSKVLKMLFPTISDDMVSLVGPLVKITYNKAFSKLPSMHKDENGRWSSFKGLSATDMPTFSDFFDSIVYLQNECKKENSKIGDEFNIEDLKALKNRVRQITNDYKIYFDGHTNIATHGNIVSFGTKALTTLSNELQNALYYLMFQYSWVQCLDETKESAFIIDEAHTLILKENTAHLVSQFVRRSRKYRNVMLIGTQEPHDFADPKILTDGKAIFNNSAYKVVLGMAHDAVKDLTELETLNESECNFVERCPQGSGLLMIGNQRRIPMYITLSKAELRDIDAMFQ